MRELISHVVSGNLMFTNLVTGAGAPAGGDPLGDDAVEAFRSSLGKLRDAFSAEGVMDRTFQTPMGERPAARLVTTRLAEMSIHGWDLARSTGQVIDLPEPVVEAALAQLGMMLSGDRTGMPFDAERQAPEGAPHADRLAAFAGREVA